MMKLLFNLILFRHFSSNRDMDNSKPLTINSLASSVNNSTPESNLLAFPLKVVKSYHNLAENLDQIKEELKNLPGVYSFQHKVSGHLYIGSSINIAKRFNEHIKGHKSNRHLNNAITKYGLESFSFYVIEIYAYNKELSRRRNGALIICLEQKYLDLLNPYYNVNKIADTVLGKILSEETKKQISLAKLGSKHSEETKAKLREARKKRDLIKEENRGRTPIYLLDKEGKMIKWYRGVQIMRRATKSSAETILKCLKEGRPFREFTLTRTAPAGFDPTTFPPEA